jgi:hypothetical protein
MLRPLFFISQDGVMNAPCEIDKSDLIAAVRTAIPFVKELIALLMLQPFGIEANFLQFT